MTNLKSAFNHGLHNGFDDQSSTNTQEFDNHIWGVSNNCSTHESDSGVASTGVMYGNTYDASSNTTNMDVAPGPNDLVVPVYATMASIKGGLTCYGNMLVGNSAVGNCTAWWVAMDAGDRSPKFSDGAFAVLPMTFRCWPCCKGSDGIMLGVALSRAQVGQG
ncbi:hypothetical protein Terro_1639 [Terriglobus roseus DSM 18391]|uniref:Uncharacterized protein n=1 Tax=Terriglobus roseus (strain DSM 18391 / NRRL B-41598 / KBS 63) TaxID=926566 RepID=I3ZFC5_TERRK|nr:hypothetical protein [Terriglobus roseus]AFL87943.1 hypothetical protein Terro_1639 [Terriglobus roseus DSM 18391]